MAVPVSLPRPRAGDYYLSVFVKSEEGVEASAAKLLTIESPFGLDRVTTTTDFVERGDKLAGLVSTRGTLPAVCVEVFTPDGNQPLQPLWGRSASVLKGGQAQVQVPVAYNDPPGQWRIKATELLSQLSVEAQWTVQ